LEGHYNIIEVDPNTNDPLLPEANARKFVNQCGVVVRDRVPINIHEWKERKDAAMIPFVSNLEKRLLWDAIIEYFTLPEGADVELVKS
jgi:predicted O-methyltransferase YrrM